LWRNQASMGSRMAKGLVGGGGGSPGPVGIRLQENSLIQERKIKVWQDEESGSAWA
jgi:hypothetical protein